MGDAKKWAWVSPPSSSQGVHQASESARLIFRMISSQTADVEQIRPRTAYEGIVFAVNADHIATNWRVFSHLVQKGHSARVIAYWTWELEQFPAAFAQLGKLFDCVLVPSSFVRESLVRAGVSPERVEIAPPIEVDCKYGENSVSNGYLLHVADSKSDFSRKGTQRLLSAYVAYKEKSSHPFQLVVKLDDSKLSRELAAEYRGFGTSFIFGQLSKDQMVALFEGCSAYVSPHASEGFGLSIWQAKDLGKSVVATNYSGNQDFFCEKCDLAIAHRMVAVRVYANYLVRSHWAEVSENAIVEALKKFEQDEALREPENHCTHFSSDSFRNSSLSGFRNAMNAPRNDRRNFRTLLSASLMVLAYVLTSRFRLTSERFLKAVPICPGSLSVKKYKDGG